MFTFFGMIFCCKGKVFKLEMVKIREKYKLSEYLQLVIIIPLL